MNTKLQAISLVAVLMFFGGVQHLQAGFIINLGFVDTPTDFTSVWEWHFAAGTWATAPVTVGGIPAFPHWQITLQGLAGGDLRDTSKHITNPDGPPEITPNALSFLNYAGASAGIGPVLSVFDHPHIPGHFDQYSLQTFPQGGGVVDIIFEGEHLPPPVANVQMRSVIPEPSTVTLLGIGLAGLLGYASRQRKQSALRHH
jgi:hypothetical protein